MVRSDSSAAAGRTRPLHGVAESAGSTMCALCASGSRHAFFIRSYSIHRCRKCGHLFVPLTLDEQHALKTYSDRYFKGGEGYPDYCADAALHRRRGRFYGNLLTRLNRRTTGTVLDVGSAAGYLLSGLEQAGWRGTGVEANAGMARHATELLGLDVRNTTFEQYADNRAYDAVMMIQVISHLYDLGRAVRNAARLTRRGSLWVVETWDRNSIMARLHGRQWHEFNPPSVLHWFSPEGLALLAAKHGFAPVAKGRPPKRISAAHAQAVLHNAGPTAFNRMASACLSILPAKVSLPYPGDDVFYMVFRKES